MSKHVNILIVLPILSLTMGGCVYFNDEGIGTRKYRDCVEYYDAEGIYHKKCDKNLIDYRKMSPPKATDSY